MADMSDRSWKQALKDFVQRNWGYVLGVVLSVITVVWMLYTISTSSQPSPRESAYQAIMLTVASVFAS